MRKIIFCTMMVGMLSGSFTACTTYLDTAERYVLPAALCALQDKDDSQGLYLPLILPREFFDAKDFGIGHDGMYRNPPYRNEGDRAGSGKGQFRTYGRQEGCRDSESSFFGRHAPLMLPDVEYGK